jgi:poly(A) polymerase
MTERTPQQTMAQSEIAVQRRIAPPSWIVEPATQAILAALAAGGAKARFVGGAVRDALVGGPDAGLNEEEDSASAAQNDMDIDIATPAAPELVVELLRQAGIKVVPTGLAHGTVTAVVPPRHFEITTLRRDVETYGRHARVTFDADWTSDAARRDFTINAIFLDPDGTLHDPVGGLADLAARRVRFVGDPTTRISEDVLRLLRYYRFEARFGGGDGDAAARAACCASVRLLTTLSAERLAQELIRLLLVPDPVRSLRMMSEDRVLAAVLPEADRVDRLEHLIEINRRLPQVYRRVDPPLYLAALVTVNRAGAAALAGRLRLSNAWRERLMGLAQPWPLDPTGDAGAQRRVLYEDGEDRFRDLARLLAAEGIVTEARLGELLDLAENWIIPRFPLAGRDVTALGIAPGERVGRLLRMVKNWWEEDGFTADRAQCLAYLRRVAAAPEAGSQP